jgi:uncharacterized protein
MGNPVVHFEIMGRDGAALQSFYGDLFGWKIVADNPMGYGVVAREENVTAEGVGIGGGVGDMPEGVPGHLTFYVEVPSVEVALARAESMGGNRLMGPESPMEGLTLGMFSDPEGNVVGVIEPQG